MLAFCTSRSNGIAPLILPVEIQDFKANVRRRAVSLSPCKASRVDDNAPHRLAELSDAEALAMSTPVPNADRNVLFGILALQMNFVSRGPLIQALNAWVLHRNPSL